MSCRVVDASLGSAGLTASAAEPGWEHKGLGGSDSSQMQGETGGRIGGLRMDAETSRSMTVGIVISPDFPPLGRAQGVTGENTRPPPRGPAATPCFVPHGPKKCRTIWMLCWTNWTPGARNNPRGRRRQTCFQICPLQQSIRGESSWSDLSSRVERVGWSRRLLVDPRLAPGVRGATSAPLRCEPLSRISVSAASVGLSLSLASSPPIS